MMKFVDITKDDRDWVSGLFKANRAIWPGGGQMEWWRYWQRTETSTEQWKKILVDDVAVGFIHWRPRRDGWKTLYDLVIDAAYKGRGHGQAAVNLLGDPIRLKALVGGGAEPFYARLGFTNVKTATSKNGKQTFIVFERGAVSPVPDPVDARVD